MAMPDEFICVGPCGLTLPIKEASKDKTYRDGWKPWCHKCQHKRQQGYKKADPESHRLKAALAQRKHRAKVGGYSMLSLDNAVCEVCGTSGTRSNFLVTDHDHITGKTRGVLCRRCNLGLGNFGDDADKLYAAIKYLDSVRNANG